MDYVDTELQECSECAAKPGSPTLCRSCLHNQDVITKLKAMVDALQTDLDKSRGRLGVIATIAGWGE